MSSHLVVLLSAVVLSGVNCGIAVGGGMRLKMEYLCSRANICSIPVRELHTLLVTEHTIACTAGLGMSHYRELCFEKAADLHPQQTSPSLAEVTRTDTRRLLHQGSPIMSAQVAL